MATKEAVRGHAITVLESAARTATPTVDTFRSVGGATQLLVVIDITAVTADPSIVFTIVGYDPVSGKTWTVLASAAQTGTGTVILRVSPHLTGSANLIAKDIVPAFWKVTAVHADADSATYSVAAQLS